MNKNFAISNAMTVFLHVANFWSENYITMSTGKFNAQLIIHAENDRAPLDRIWKDLTTMVTGEIEQEINYYKENDFYAMILTWNF